MELKQRRTIFYNGPESNTVKSALWQSLTSSRRNWNVSKRLKPSSNKRGVDDQICRHYVAPYLKWKEWKRFFLRDSRETGLKGKINSTVFEIGLDFIFNFHSSFHTDKLRLNNWIFDFLFIMGGQFVTFVRLRTQ